MHVMRWIAGSSSWPTLDCAATDEWRAEDLSLDTCSIAPVR
jgi:hypothetical protein